MATQTDLFLSDGARFQVVPNDELRAIWIRGEHGSIEATMHFGMGDGRPSFSLAVDQLEALVTELVELHAQLGDKVGRPHLRVTVAEPPAGPDDPTDEPTDEPATGDSAGAAGSNVPDRARWSMFATNARALTDGAVATYTDDPDPVIAGMARNERDRRAAL